MEQVKYNVNRILKPVETTGKIFLFGTEAALEAAVFLNSFPQYKETPLHNLRQLAGKLNLAGIYVKDESQRFGMNSFKVLGSAYALGRILAEELGLPPAGLTLEKLRRRRYLTGLINGSGGRLNPLSFNA